MSTLSTPANLSHATLTVTSPTQTRLARVRVDDGYVTLRPSEGEPMRWPASLIDGATLYVDGATSLEPGCVSVQATQCNEPERRK